MKKLIELDFLSVYDNYTIHNDYKDKDSICLNFNGFVFLLNKYNELTSMYYNYEYYHYILNLNKQNIEVVFIYNHDTYPEYKIYFNSENELKNKLEKIN